MAYHELYLFHGVTMSKHALDITGSKKSLPILNIKKSLSAMDSGEDLEITSSNSIEADLTSFCNVTKNILIELSNNADE